MLGEYTPYGDQSLQAPGPTCQRCHSWASLPRTKTSKRPSLLVAAAGAAVMVPPRFDQLLQVQPGLSLAGEQGVRRIIKLSYDEQRVNPSLRVAVRDNLQRAEQALDGLRRGGRREPRSTLRAYLWELQRFFGLRAKRVEVPASSVGRAQCFHLEVDVVFPRFS